MKPSKMKNWIDYKRYIKNIDTAGKEEMECIETMASIIGSIIDRRNELDISQRELAKLCGMSQSSVARIESYRTTPSIDTLLRVMKPLGLTLSVSRVDH